MSTELYTRIVSMDYGDQERSDLMAKVWGATPFVVNVRTGSPGEDAYREIIQWARAELGPQAMPIHGHDGDWQTGSATVFGETFIGFKHEIDLARFSEAFGHLIIADQTSPTEASGTSAIRQRGESDG